MKPIALYLVLCFCGNIFVIAYKQKDASCNYKTFLSTCCSDNEVYNIHNGTINIICSACIGRLCRPTCPQGYYGEQCNGTCTCNADVCDDVFGCITTDNGNNNQILDEQQGNPLEMVLKLSLSASLFIIIVLLVVLLNVVYRARKNNTGYPTVSTERNASNESSDNITRDSPVIYAAVVRPNRKPVKGVEQSDQMYGNTLKLQKPNRERGRCKNCTTATYSFVEHPNKTSPLDVRNADRASSLDVRHPERVLSLDKGHHDGALSLDVRHHGRTLSSNEGQYDQEYGNMTMC